MYFKCQFRNNPSTNQSEPYLRLVESYRNFDDRVCHRTILNVGFTNHLTRIQFLDIQTRLTDLAHGKSQIFESSDPVVNQYVTSLWAKIESGKKVDFISNNLKKWVDSDTIKHKDVREIGAEWLCYQSLGQLGLGSFLEAMGWESEQIQLTLTQIISRAVYPVSELKTTRLIRDNSAVCQITGYPLEQLTKDKLYQNALKLYQSKDALEQYLSRKTNELFDLEDKIVLYDLTNTYFEGEKRNSALARFGRSKEKRSDAKIIVLALVINQEGFLKYSSVFEGNTSDSTTLSNIIDNLRIQTSQQTQKATIVLDAGIATESNLALLAEKGYNYVCVSRSRLKDYKEVEGHGLATTKTRNKQTLQLQRVSTEKSTDYFLKVSSPGKLLKETGIRNQFETRFVAELEKIRQSLGKKSGVKKSDKVHQRIGRAMQKYPSVSKYYELEVVEKEGGIIESISWKKGEKESKDELGVYFLRTNMEVEQEDILWKIYNIIREIESTFRSLKTDLDLRPIYHKTDDATLAHLHLGLLAYWVVNTIRYQLKINGENASWPEIKRIASTQKLVITQATNIQEELVQITKCSEPKSDLEKLYQLLDYKPYPYLKRKSVVHDLSRFIGKPENKKTEPISNQLVMDE